MSELLPCPFCGTAAHLDGIDGHFKIGCQHCECILYYDDIDIYYISEELAFKAWNRRASQGLDREGLETWCRERIFAANDTPIGSGNPSQTFGGGQNTILRILLMELKQGRFDHPTPPSQPHRKAFRQVKSAIRRRI